MLHLRHSILWAALCRVMWFMMSLCLLRVCTLSWRWIGCLSGYAWRLVEDRLEQTTRTLLISDAQIVNDSTIYTLLILFPTSLVLG